MGWLGLISAGHAARFCSTVALGLLQGVVMQVLGWFGPNTSPKLANHIHNATLKPVSRGLEQAFLGAKFLLGLSKPEKKRMGHASFLVAK